MAFTFSKYFEKYENYHSFVDLLNLCKEVSDYIYNNDIINSKFFDIFVETPSGYEIIFNKNDKDDYYININKETIKNQKDDNVLIDKVYEEIENLYSILKNDEFLINIKQMDENLKSFNQINESFDDLKLKNILDELNINFLYDDFNNIYNCWNDEYNFDIYQIFDSGIYHINYWKRNKESNIEPVYDPDDPFGEEYPLDEDNQKIGIDTKNIKKSLMEILKINNENLKTFNQFSPIKEGFEEDLSNKISDKYLSLKKGILKLLDDTLESDFSKLQDFMEQYIKEESEEILNDFVEDADIFEFYLKYQSDIDSLLLDKGYYDDPPEVESLYDYVIDGTYDAVIYCMEEMKNEFFES